LLSESEADAPASAPYRLSLWFWFAVSCQNNADFCRLAK